MLLHGNPAVDIFSGIKLAACGELGYGVGEEEWGSGERAVLEDLVHRTEGLVDVVVSRFGDLAPAEENKSTSEVEVLPWMGSGNQPIASDGVIFGGVGALERHSLRNVSLWMRQIYACGEYAYGVRDNPLRERRKRRRKNPAEQDKPAIGYVNKVRSASRSALAQQNSRSDEGDENYGRTERQSDSHNVPDDTTTPDGPQPAQGDESRPSIPPPIVTAAEEALRKATRQAEQDKEVTEGAEDNGTTFGIPDQYMKYLTFGLSTLGRTTQSKRPPHSRQPSHSDSKALRRQRTENSANNTDQSLPYGDEDDAPMLKHLEPMPEGDSVKTKIAIQKHQENRGYFLIGLQGNLDKPEEDGNPSKSEDRSPSDSSGSRIMLRTIQVETVLQGPGEQIDEDAERTPSAEDIEADEIGTKNFRRIRVLIYVLRPFIYCFLFDDRTSSLQLAGFYRSLHQNLKPIHKPLLSSTAPEKVANGIENTRATASESESASASAASTTKSPSKSTRLTPIFDLIYDPRLLTLHTSIPNIPEPGTPAAEGIFMSLMNDATTRPTWTRIEALNVHSQILNTLTSVKGRRKEIERTSKTNRGWWVVWMKIAPSAPGTQEAAEESKGQAESSASSDAPTQDMAAKAGPKAQADMHRTAFLVRKASDSSSSFSISSTSSRAVSSMFGNMSLDFGGGREEETGGANAGWGPAALAGGIGVDARKYVQGLLSLNR